MERAREWAGIRPIDVAATIIVMGAVVLDVATATGPGQRPLDALTYLGGAALALPVLLRRRWPQRELYGCAVLLLCYYIFDRRNISPAPLLCLPLYDATVAGYLLWSIIIPTLYMIVGFFVVDASTHQGVGSVAAEFLQSVAVLFLAVTLGEVVRGRRALAVETADRLRLADEEREAEGARRVAEERLRIARDLHDTVAHSMATITVQAGSALHVLDGQAAGPGAERLRTALGAIRETSKSALTDIRTTLGRLRPGETGAGGDDPDPAEGSGLDRLPALTDAVTAAGAPVTLSVEGDQVPLPAAVDQAAYRILQESLTNVLRHAGPDASARVCLTFGPGALTIRVRDDGGGPGQDGRPGVGGPQGWGGGHGITGMTERAVALGGELTAGPLPGGGFEVMARLPFEPAGVAGQPGVRP